MNIPYLTGKNNTSDDFLSGIKKSYIPESVFEDLGLKSMISENMVSFLSAPVPKEDILMRQDVIKEVVSQFSKKTGDSKNPEEISCFMKFKRLSDILSEISSARFNFNHSISDVEKDVLFVTLSSKVRRYIEESSTFEGNAEFIREYCSYFKSFVDSEEYHVFSDELSNIEKTLETITIHTVRVMRGKALVVHKGETGDDLITLVMKYAAEMKVPNVTPNAKLGRKLPVPLIESFAELNPEMFGRMRKFRENYKEYISGDTDRCKRECEFYIETKTLSDKLRQRGIPISFAEISDVREYIADEIYDISLIGANYDIIPNAAEFTEKDNFYFLTGANGGGKTTYIRTVGIALILFLGGCFVPCRKAKIYPFTKMFAHFPRDERFEGNGRLVDEKNRADEILKNSDKDTFVLFNETFSGTDEIKSAQMTEELGRTCYDRGIFGVYVTHIHSTGDLNIPMLNVVVDTDDNNRRTFKVLRRDGIRSSYAYDILKKYGLTALQLAELKISKSEKSGGDTK